MQVVWLRATFFMASSSFPPKSSHTSATCRAGGISEEHRRKCGYICKPEHMRRENMNFKFLPLTPSSRQEWPRWAEMWWGAPRAQSSGEGTVPTTQWATVPPLPCVTSPFLLYLPHLTPAFSHLLPGWTAEGTWRQQQLRLPRERDQEPEKQTKKKRSISRGGSSSSWSPISGARYDVCLPPGERQGCQVWGLCIRRGGGFPYTPKMPP